MVYRWLGASETNALACALAGQSAQAVGLPIETAFDHPLQDSSRFAEQLLLEIHIRRLRLQNERDDIEPALGGIVHVVKGRSVVADDHQLELRFVIKEVLVRETRRDEIATRQLLDARFGPRLIRFGLRRRNETGNRSILFSISRCVF